MTRRLLGLAAAMFAAGSIGCAQTSPAAPPIKLPSKAPGRYFESLTMSGVRRTYILRVPSAYDATRPLPLVVMLHGWTSSASDAERTKGMAKEAEKNGFIFVAPNGLGEPQGWNAGFIDLSGARADDVAFINALLDRVEAEVGVDPDRVYVAGHSNGAFLAHLLASRLSNRIAAIAAVAGTIGVPNREGVFKMIPEPVGPVSVLLIHGKHDAMVSYDASSAALFHGVGAMASAYWWARRDGCSLRPTETRSLNGNVVTDVFSGGKNGTEVKLVSIVNGIHDWPGGVGLDGPELNTGVNAADLIWRFFSTHPKQR